jgi:inorganic triphosphatase YgiF
MSEVELKFELPPEAHADFGKLAPLAVARPGRKRLLAMYFDTPGCELAKHAMALRLRRSGRTWKQALKAGPSGAGGLHSREEWEFERPDASIDLALFAHTPLAKLAGAADLHRQLREVFRVDVERTTWELEVAPGTRLEVALDRGEVVNANGCEPVSEVEIEILEGEAPELFDFAGRLVEAAPLRPSSVTKAERGYRLARGERPAPVKSRAPKLDAAMTPLEAARVTLACALAQLQANEAGALATSDPEYLHQMRVAMRRLRSALRAFRDALDPAFARAADAGLRAIAGETGPARDWDVLATQTLPALLEAYGDPDAKRTILARVAARRRIAREAMRNVLRSAAYARVVLVFARWLAAPQAAPTAAEDLVSFASRAAARRHRKLVARARHLARLDAAARHKLRIEAKRVRYVVEAFAALFPKKPVKAYLGALADIQDDLGDANDAAVARAHLQEVAMPTGAAKFARRWLEAEELAATSRLAPHFERLAGSRRFWEKD